MKNSIIFTCFFFLLVTNLLSQNASRPNPVLLTQPWQAKWITHPGISGRETAVYLFKKSFNIDAVPEHFTINISADNRYNPG